MCLFCSPVVHLRKSAWSPWGDCVALWSVQGLNTNMSEAGDDWEFYWRRGKKALHVLINALFCTFFWCSCCSGFREKVSALKGRGGQGGGTSCPQQWNISSVLRPLLTEGARCHTETEHLLHSNVLLPRSRNIRVEGRGILLLEMWYFLGWTVRNLEKVWSCVCLFVPVRSCT